MSSKEETDKEETDYWFNEGRLVADKKWINAIDRRIAELERSVGIPELRKLKKEIRYRWENIEKSTKPKKGRN